MTPVVGGTVMNTAYAESAHSREQAYVREFFDSNNNMDSGHTIDGLHASVHTLLTRVDSSLAETWNAISIRNSPEQAAQFLVQHKDTLAIPDMCHDKNRVANTLKETASMEFLDHLLFSYDEAIMTTYEYKDGWNALVSHIRYLASGTQYADIAHAIPYQNEFTCTADQRVTTVQNIITQYTQRFPHTLQKKADSNNIFNMSTLFNARDRMKRLLKTF